jgi:hypothetical protein
MSSKKSKKLITSRGSRRSEYIMDNSDYDYDSEDNNSRKSKSKKLY